MRDLRVETRAVGPDRLADLALLFGGCRNTRNCWCMAFCSSRGQFAAGWVTGGNRRRFEAAARSARVPMGLLAYEDGDPVGWCACGPRRRYAGAGRARRALLEDLAPDEDDTVWLVPCLFVRPDRRGTGVTRTLLRAAVDLAARSGAVAVEGWPLTGEERSSEAFVGRRPMFEELGFQLVSEPRQGRCIMRRELAGAAGRQRPGPR